MCVCNKRTNNFNIFETKMEQKKKHSKLYRREFDKIIFIIIHDLKLLLVARRKFCGETYKVKLPYICGSSQTIQNQNLSFR